jgi:hypothetical protein
MKDPGGPVRDFEDDLRRDAEFRRWETLLTSGRAKGAILVTAAVIGILLSGRGEEANRPTPSPGSTAAPLPAVLVIGECVDVTRDPPALGEETEHVSIAPVSSCDVAHDAEIILVRSMPTALDPPDPRVADFEAFAAEVCPLAFGAYVGTRPTVGPPVTWSFTYERTNPDPRAARLRVICYARRADGVPMTTSVRGQHGIATPRPSRAP